MTIDNIIEAGGVLAFAGLVYLQVREQTKVLKEIADHMVRVVERQAAIMDRQRMIRDDLARSGVAMRDLPEPELEVQTEAKSA